MPRPIKNRLKRVGESGIFHDSRADARLIARFANEIADKVNELIEENESLKLEIKSIIDKTTLK